MIIGKDRQPRPARKFVFRDPAAYRFGHAAQFVIRTAFEVIVALQFQRNVVRPALRALDKAVVESGHGSWRIYTKKSLGRRKSRCFRASRNGPYPRAKQV